MSDASPGFVFIHGAWHNAATWRHIIPLLEAKGYVAKAIDLPGAGVHAKSPAAYGRRPFDSAAFAAEASPNAGVTQEQRTEAVIAAVGEVGATVSGGVILVGHSLGGVTISDVAEAIPDRIRALVYLAAFLLLPGESVLSAIQTQPFEDARLSPLMLGDPAATGALRLNPQAEDRAYRDLAHTAFYGDVGEAEFMSALTELHCDEPVSVAVRPSMVTPERFGTVSRHYIRCVEDRAIPIAGQDHMIAACDRILGGKTRTHTMETSHSPFLSDPAGLVRNLVSIAG